MGHVPRIGLGRGGKMVVNTTLPPTHAGDYWERRQESVLKALTDYAKVEVCRSASARDRLFVCIVDDLPELR